MEEEKLVSLENLPKSSKKSRLFFILLGLVILVLISEGIYWLKLRKEKEGTVSRVVPTSVPEPKAETFFPSPVPHPAVTLEAPVQKESLTKGKMIQIDYGINDWAFSLSEGEPIYAAFSGQIELAGEKDSQKLIVLTSEDSQLVWKYLFSGTTPEIERGSQVKKGDVLAKASQTPLPTRDVNLIIQVLWKGKRVSIDQDFLNTF